MKDSMKRVLREPLLHFILLGILIFAVYGIFSDRGGEDTARIEITRSRIESMAEGFARTWQRPPTTEELDGLISDRVREEVYCREAIALGLDKDDTIIRRRLRQKLEFIADDASGATEPSDQELNAYLQTHADQFRLEPRITFRQVYLSPATHGANLAIDAEQLLARLRRTGDADDPGNLGDPILVGHSFEAEPAGEVGKLFGEQFVRGLERVIPGQWQGPVESGYGLHLVFVTERTEGRVPELGEVRDAVRRELVDSRKRDSDERLYEKLLKHYEVIVETSPPHDGGRNLSAAEQ